MEPFTGLPAHDCTAKGRQMWDAPLPYDPVKIFATGFNPGSADINLLLDDAASPHSLPSDSEGLVFWAIIYGAAAGDTISLDVRAPDGSPFASSTETLPKNKIRYFRFTGRKRPAGNFAPGVYKATATLIRKGLQRSAENSVVVK
jgi:hypothetical protein